MTITLQEITKANWQQVIKLKLADEQKNWVAPNWYSILEAHYEGGFARAIYADDTLVGFTYFGHDDDSGRWYIVRLMIGLEQQGKGYGRAALHEIINTMRQNPDCHEIYISFEPDNDVARHLYASIGFEDTGTIEDGEVVFRLPAK